MYEQFNFKLKIWKENLKFRWHFRVARSPQVNTSRVVFCKFLEIDF